MDGDGSLKSDEIYQMLKLMVGNYLNNEELLLLASSTLKAADLDGDGVLSFQEFQVAMQGFDIQKRMSIEFPD